MPETRYKEIFFYENGELIKVEQEPYEVSDEQIAQEEQERRIEELKNKPKEQITTADLIEMFKLLF